MAVLEPVHWQAVTPTMREMVRFIGRQPFSQRFYLAGGTALALRLGHRVSVDLDFFSAVDEITRPTRQEILTALAPLSPLSMEEVDGNLLLEVSGLHLGFFSYGYPLVEPADTLEQIALASVVDIGLMKLDALISRGSRKDFYGLYFIARQVSISDLLDLGQTKYPYARDFEVMAVESLVFFENADRDIQPTMLTGVAWDDVRQFFIEQAQTLGQSWFGPDETEG